MNIYINLLISHKNPEASARQDIPPDDRRSSRDLRQQVFRYKSNRQEIAEAINKTIDHFDPSRTNQASKRKLNFMLFVFQ